MTRVLAIGECMIELTHTGPGSLSLGYAGDTFNTAVYLSRLGGVRVDYLTLLGDDDYSTEILAAMRAEQIGTQLIRRVVGSRPGLYLVRTDDDGERSFTYYRSESPVRRLFDDEHAPDICGYDLVYLSAITLQVLTPRARERLWERLRDARVVFDSNYRAAGWDSVDQARDAVRRTWELTWLALPTFADEQALFGDDSPAATVERLRGYGISDVVVKDGARGCVVWDGERVRHSPAPPVESVVDSTAAGDAFNAGYLSARLRGAEPFEATKTGHAIAARVLGHRGAILPRDGYQW